MVAQPTWTGLSAQVDMVAANMGPPERHKSIYDCFLALKAGNHQLRLLLADASPFGPSPFFTSLAHKNERVSYYHLSPMVRAAGAGHGTHVLLASCTISRNLGHLAHLRPHVQDLNLSHTRCLSW